VQRTGLRPGGTGRVCWQWRWFAMESCPSALPLTPTVSRQLYNKKSMDENNRAQWKRFLDPEVLRPNLILASIYIAAFEVLKNSIIERIRNFYISRFDGKEWIVSPEYKEHVLSKDKSPTYASLKWLKESEAITDDDIKKFGEIKEYRNLLAHEITKMLTEGLPSDFTDRFNDMVELLDKIEKWWIINVEIPTNPDFDGKYDEIDEKEIISGLVMSLRMMIDVALGSDEKAKFYINEYKKIIGDL
jgi:hypothetical protein